MLAIFGTRSLWGCYIGSEGGKALAALLKDTKINNLKCALALLTSSPSQAP